MILKRIKSLIKKVVNKMPTVIKKIIKKVWLLVRRKPTKPEFKHVIKKKFGPITATSTTLTLVEEEEKTGYGPVGYGICPYLVDSYPEVNQDGDLNIQANFPCSGGDFCAVGQCFTTPIGTKYNMCEAKFYLRRQGTLDGVLEARLYDTTGHCGDTCVPTGAPLAVSDSVPINNVGFAFSLISFFFADPLYCMEVNHCYAIVVVARNCTLFDEQDFIEVGTDISDPTHAGNTVVYRTSAWSTRFSDTIFYVYGRYCTTNTSTTIVITTVATTTIIPTTTIVTTTLPPSLPAIVGKAGEGKVRAGSEDEYQIVTRPHLKYKGMEESAEQFSFPTSERIIKREYGIETIGSLGFEEGVDILTTGSVWTKVYTDYYIETIGEYYDFCETVVLTEGKVVEADDLLREIEGKIRYIEESIQIIRKEKSEETIRRVREILNLKETVQGLEEQVATFKESVAEEVKSYKEDTKVKMKEQEQTIEGYKEDIDTEIGRLFDELRREGKQSMPKITEKLLIDQWYLVEEVRFISKERKKPEEVEMIGPEVTPKLEMEKKGEVKLSESVEEEQIEGDILLHEEQIVDLNYPNEMIIYKVFLRWKEETEIFKEISDTEEEREKEVRRLKGLVESVEII